MLFDDVSKTLARKFDSQGNYTIKTFITFVDQMSQNLGIPKTLTFGGVVQTYSGY